MALPRTIRHDERMTGRLSGMGKSKSPYSKKSVNELQTLIAEAVVAAIQKSVEPERLVGFVADALHKKVEEVRAAEELASAENGVDGGTLADDDATTAPKTELKVEEGLADVDSWLQGAHLLLTDVLLDGQAAEGDAKVQLPVPKDEPPEVHAEFDWL